MGVGRSHGVRTQLAQVLHDRADAGVDQQARRKQQQRSLHQVGHALEIARQVAALAEDLPVQAFVVERIEQRARLEPVIADRFARGLLQHECSRIGLLQEAVVDQSHRGTAQREGAVGVGLRGHRREPQVAHRVVCCQPVQHRELRRRVALHHLLGAAPDLIAGLALRPQNVDIVADIAAHGRHAVCGELLGLEELGADVIEILAGIDVGHVEPRRAADRLRPDRAGRIRIHPGVKVESMQAVISRLALLERRHVVGRCALLVQPAEQAVERAVLEHQQHDVFDILVHLDLPGLGPGRRR